MPQFALQITTNYDTVQAFTFKTDNTLDVAARPFVNNVNRGTLRSEIQDIVRALAVMPSIKGLPPTAQSEDMRTDYAQAYFKFTVGGAWLFEAQRSGNNIDLVAVAATNLSYTAFYRLLQDFLQWLQGP